MLHILEGFQPDEYARDPIDPVIIAVLKDEQAVAPSTRPPLSDLAYRPQVDDATLLKVGDVMKLLQNSSEFELTRMDPSGTRIA